MPSGPAGRPWWTRAAHPKLAKRLTRIGLAALMLAMPVMVSASHQFSDVPTSNTYHTSISRLYGARITTGCGPGKFCPNANVTRGQMAAFLNRGLGRGAFDWGNTAFTDHWATFDNGVIADLDLVHGGAPGGTGHVLVTASLTAYSVQADVCPCELSVYLANLDTGEISEPVFEVIGTEPAPPDTEAAVWYEGSASVSYLFSVRSGITQTYQLAAAMRTTLPPGNFDAGVAWNMSALYVPFGANGGNPVFQPTTTQGHREPGAH